MRLGSNLVPACVTAGACAALRATALMPRCGGSRSLVRSGLPAHCRDPLTAAGALKAQARRLRPPDGCRGGLPDRLTVYAAGVHTTPVRLTGRPHGPETLGDLAVEIVGDLACRFGMMHRCIDGVDQPPL